MNTNNKKKRNRKLYSFYLSDKKKIDEIEQLFKYSKSRSMSAFLRKKVFSKKITNIGEQEATEIKKLLYELNNQIYRVGHNINQITKVIHTVNLVSDYAEQLERVKFYQEKLIEIGQEINTKLQYKI